jgi:hypothetical protein
MHQCVLLAGHDGPHQTGAQAVSHVLDSGDKVAKDDGWQSIETAPRDGSCVLLLIPYDAPYEACVTSGQWRSSEGENGCFRFGGDDGEDDIQPIFWRPLPPPPASIEEDKK